MRGEKPTIDIEFKVEVVVEPDEDGFHAYCPAFKGLHTSGDTKEEALENAGYAAAAYIQSLISHKDPIPVGVVVSESEQALPLLPVGAATRYTEDLTVACAIS